MANEKLIQKHRFQTESVKRPDVEVRPNPSNYSRIGKSHTFIVRTQAGFKKIVRRYKRDWGIRESYGYPRSYPSLITIGEGYKGYFYLSITCLPVNKVMEAIRESDRLYLEEINE